MRSEVYMTNVSPSSSTSTLPVQAEALSTLVPAAASVRWAEDPFKKKSGDVILRSSDSLHFRLHKSVLGNASPIFEDIFSNAKPNTTVGLKAEDEEMGGLPVIHVEEDGAALSCLLRFYYEPFTLKLPNLVLSPATLCNIILAARKYSMAYAEGKINVLFREFCTQRGSYRIATEAYAIATQKGMAQEIRAAAKASLFHIPDYGYSGAFDHIPGSDVLKMIRYRQKCLEAVRAVIGWDERKKLWRFERWCVGGRLVCDSRYDKENGFNFWRNPSVAFKPGGRSETQKVHIIDELHKYFLEVTSELRERPHPQVIYDDKHQDQLRFAAYSLERDRVKEHGPDRDNCKPHIEAFERMFFQGIQAAIENVDFDTA